MSGILGWLAVPFLIAAGAALVSGGPTVSWLRSRKAEQPISPDAPEKHRLKHGTPTMGGLVIVVAVLISVFACSQWFPVPSRRLAGLLAVCGVFLGGCGIGLVDDWGKLRHRDNARGLSERWKLGLQLAVGVAFSVVLWASGVPTRIGPWELGLVYYGIAALVVVGYGNAANFTDGLDGLLAGSTALAAGALAILVSAVSDRPEIALFCASLSGACVAFLWWNGYPARVFSGDTGSLAVGMGLSSAAVVSGQLVPFALLTVVWLAEIASMMLQRYVFKWRRIRHGLEYAKAHRVFRRAPLHHHFEECGWHETRVVVRFCLVSALAAGVVLCLP